MRCDITGQPASQTTYDSSDVFWKQTTQQTMGATGIAISECGLFAIPDQVCCLLDPF